MSAAPPQKRTKRTLRTARTDAFDKQVGEIEADYEKTGKLPPGDFPDNDAGRAAQFCERWKDEVRYVPERGIWLTWEDRWVQDINGGLDRRAMRLADEQISAAAARPALTQDDLRAKDRAVRTAAKWGNNNVIVPMLKLAAALPVIQCRQSSLDADPFLLGTPNAVIDLRTGIADYHRRDQLVTKVTGAEYDLHAKSPRWDKFLVEVFPDEEVRRYVWKAAGYSATGDMSEEVFFVLHNTGRNGKSKYVNTLAYVLGDYARTAGSGLVVVDDRGGDAKREKADIVGVRFLRAPEAEGRQKLNVRLIKDITGGDPLSAEAKYESAFNFNPVCKLWWAVNEKPTIHEVGPAIWERIRLIPFERYFEPHERDLKLEAKLRAEASGILNWLIEGARLWKEEGLADVPAKVRAAVDEYRAEEDTLADFIEAHIEAAHGAVLHHSYVFKRYQDWATESGITKSKLSSGGLRNMLAARGWERSATRSGTSRTNWLGVALKPE